jgi:hypothetical protein
LWNLHTLVHSCMKQGSSSEATAQVAQLTGTLLLLMEAKFHCSVRNNPPLNPVLSYNTAVHSNSPYLFKIYFNIIIPSTLMSSKRFLQVFRPNGVCISLTSHTQNMPRPPHSCQFNHPNSNTDLQFLIMQ